MKYAFGKVRDRFVQAMEVSLKGKLDHCILNESISDLFLSSSTQWQKCFSKRSLKV